MDLELNQSKRNNEVLQIKHQRKYEDRYNLNASNIIKTACERICDEKETA